MIHETPIIQIQQTQPTGGDRLRTFEGDPRRPARHSFSEGGVRGTHAWKPERLFLVPPAEERKSMMTIYHARDISLQNVLLLKEGFRERVRNWLQECWSRGVNVYLYDGFRSMGRQAILFSQGRTTPGRIVTRAEPGQSFHNYGLAFDFVPLKQMEKAKDCYEAAWNDVDGYSGAMELAQKYDLRGLSWETGHLEDATLKDWREAKLRSDKNETKA